MTPKKYFFYEKNQIFFAQKIQKNVDFSLKIKVKKLIFDPPNFFFDKKIQKKWQFFKGKKIDF